MANSSKHTTVALTREPLRRIRRRRGRLAATAHRRLSDDAFASDRFCSRWRAHAAVLFFTASVFILSIIS